MMTRTYYYNKVLAIYDVAYSAQNKNINNQVPYFGYVGSKFPHSISAS